jgi:hypothetical protein
MRYHGACKIRHLLARSMAISSSRHSIPTPIFAIKNRRRPITIDPGVHILFTSTMKVSLAPMNRLLPKFIQDIPAQANNLLTLPRIHLPPSIAAALELWPTEHRPQQTRILTRWVASAKRGLVQGIDYLAALVDTFAPFVVSVPVRWCPGPVVVAGASDRFIRGFAAAMVDVFDFQGLAGRNWGIGLCGNDLEESEKGGGQCQGWNGMHFGLILFLGTVADRCGIDRLSAILKYILKAIAVSRSGYLS